MYAADKLANSSFNSTRSIYLLPKIVPHVAFKMGNQEEAMCGEEAILCPYEQIDVYSVALINNACAPVADSDDIIW